MKLLFVCTHNRCRSILSEAIGNHLANGSITAYSAGSQPVAEVHPLSLKYLQQRGISTEGLKSQSWDEFEMIEPDVVITVCDSAANEPCPVWFAKCLTAHWRLSDPSRLSGTEEEIQQAFFVVMDIIEARMQKLQALDLSALNQDALRSTLNSIANEA